MSGCSATCKCDESLNNNRRSLVYSFVRAFRIVLMGARIDHMDDLGSVRTVVLFSVSPASFFVEIIR